MFPWYRCGRTSLGQVMMRGNLGFDFCTTMASMRLGWSDPRLTKQWETPAAAIASKKANDVVYISGLRGRRSRTLGRGVGLTLGHWGCGCGKVFQENRERQ